MSPAGTGLELHNHMIEDDASVLSRIAMHDMVLDVGGWACPFNRADWVVDAEPYASRGYYGTIGLPSSQGGSREYFTAASWVQRDLCERAPWPFADKQFDFSICSHTLEDLRDPLFVCSELIRVSKAGYIEVPSRLWETCRGVEHPRIAGLSHHRWLVEREGNRLRFLQKFHCLHAEGEYSLPTSFARQMTPDETVTKFYWQGTFSFEEVTIHGVDAIYASCADYVRQHHRYPAVVKWAWAAARQIKRIRGGIMRRLPMRRSPRSGT